MTRSRFLAVAWLILAAVVLMRCAPDYRDLSTPNGRQAVLDEANDDLTAGLCDQAIGVLTPLIQSQYVTSAAWMVYASAYACKGGFSLLSLASNVAKASGSDVFSPVVASDYSANNSDGHITNLQLAATALRSSSMLSATIGAPYLSAANRSNDANAYMIFVQLTIIGSTISTTVMGNADPTTGKKRVSIAGKGTNADLCRVQNSVATISNCLQYIQVGGTALTNIQTVLKNLCGGTCAGNLDPAVCTATEQALGTAYIAGIDAVWL